MIEINGKVYRNLQEQVGKNQKDIEDIQADIEALQQKKKMECEDDYYKTILEVQSDDVSIKIYDKESQVEDPEYEPTEYYLAEACVKANIGYNKHLYEHNIYLNVKGRSSGVLVDDFTGIGYITYLSNSNQKFTTAAEIYSLLSENQSHTATGYMKRDSTSSEYIVPSVTGNGNSTLGVSLITPGYSPAGMITTNADVTLVLDRVRMLF